MEYVCMLYVCKTEMVTIIVLLCERDGIFFIYFSRFFIFFKGSKM
jgi:hypothetical protein